MAPQLGVARSGQGHAAVPLSRLRDGCATTLMRALLCVASWSHIARHRWAGGLGGSHPLAHRALHSLAVAVHIPHGQFLASAVSTSTASSERPPCHGSTQAELPTDSPERSWSIRRSPELRELDPYPLTLYVPRWVPTGPAQIVMGVHGYDEVHLPRGRPEQVAAFVSDMRRLRPACGRRVAAKTHRVPRVGRRGHRKGIEKVWDALARDCARLRFVDLLSSGRLAFAPPHAPWLGF